MDQKDTVAFKFERDIHIALFCYALYIKCIIYKKHDRRQHKTFIPVSGIKSAVRKGGISGRQKTFE